MIDAEFFNAMREGAYFINTARGDVVDQQALAEAMRNRGIRAGLDVFAVEPTSSAGEFQDQLLKKKALRHASRRRIDRSGSGSNRRRNCSHRS